MIYEGVIYYAISPSGKKYYGFTYDLTRRKNNHKNDSKIKKNIFYNAIRKYGFENFGWNIIESYKNEDKCYIRDILRKREKFWIEKEQTYLPEYGYNMTRGGDGGDTFTNKAEEDKILMKKERSERSKGANNNMFGKNVYNIWIEKYGKEIADRKLEERKKSSSISHIGKINPCSEQTKEKIRKKLLGCKISNESREKRLGKKNGSGKRNDEAKLNISKGHLGLPSPNKGKHASKETRDKISKAKRKIKESINN